MKERREKTMDLLPIDLDLLQKRRAIPVKLAQLSYSNSDKAVDLLRKWGEKKIAITPLYEEIHQALKENMITN